MASFFSPGSPVLGSLSLTQTSEPARRLIAVSLLRPVIGSNVEIDVIALNWFAHVRKQFAAEFK